MREAPKGIDAPGAVRGEGQSLSRSEVRGKGNVCTKAGNEDARGRQLLTPGHPSEARGISGGPETSGPAAIYTAFSSVRILRRKGKDGWGPVKLHMKILQGWSQPRRA